MAIRYFDLQNHGQLFSSLLAEVSFPWYSSGGRKRALCHRPKQTLLKPNTLVDSLCGQCFAKHMLLVLSTDCFLSPLRLLHIS